MKSHLVAVIIIALFTVSCKDTDPPIITLEGQSEMETILNESFDDPGAEAEDEKDGDLTREIDVDGKVDEDETGVYELVYEVEDNAGNEAIPVTRTVEVINEVDYLEGVYFVSANLSYGTSTGTSTSGRQNTDRIEASSTVNNRFFLDAFPVFCDLLDSELTIPRQGNFGDSWFGNGTVGQGTITINLYHDNSWGGQQEYELSYRKK